MEGWVELRGGLGWVKFPSNSRKTTFFICKPKFDEFFWNIFYFIIFLGLRGTVGEACGGRPWHPHRDKEDLCGHTRKRNVPITTWVYMVLNGRLGINTLHCSTK